MSAFRYSGLVEIRITYEDVNNRYRVYLSTPTTGARKGRTYFIHERATSGGYPERSVDHPLTYDKIARHAVSRAVWEDIDREPEAFSYAGAWTARPAHGQCAWETSDGTPPFEANGKQPMCGVYGKDIHVDRSKHAVARWLLDHPLACKGAL